MYSTHFMDEKVETPRRHVSCPTSHTWQAAEQYLNMNPDITTRAHTPLMIVLILVI